MSLPLNLMMLAAHGTSASGPTYTYATWNPSDKTNATLSNNDLTVAATTGNVNVGVRANQGFSSGKWYFEVKKGPSGSATIYIGIANSTHTLSSGTSVNNVIYAGGGVVYVESAFVAPVSTALGAGDTLGCAVDASAKTITYYHNGVSQGTWSYTLSGTIYPFYSCADNNSGNTITANFGPLTKFQPPAGYNAGVFTASGLPTFATLDPANAGSNLTLSNSNLTFNTQYSIGSNHSVRSTIGVTSGKWYWEVTFNSLVAGVGPMLGIATAANPITTGDFCYPAQGAGHGIGWYCGTGILYSDGNNIGTPGAYSAGDVFGFALDAATRVCTVYKNGVLGATFPAIGGSDAIYAAVGYCGNCTANFGATPFTYAPPAGYSHGLASTAFTPTINYATWDANDKGTYISLSNGNLSASATGVGASVRANRGVSSGKWYWEETADTVNCSLGLQKFGANLAAYPGYDTLGWSYSSNGNKYHNNSGSALGASFTTNDVIGVAYDGAAGSLTFYKNGGLIGVAWASGITGPVFPTTGNSSATAIGTANFGSTALKYSPPAGYSWGLGDRPTPFSRSYATWNPSDKDADIALSSGNLTTTATNSGSVRTTLGKTTGKWYFECTITTAGQSIIGISNGTHTITQYPGFNANSIGYEYGGNVMSSASIIASYATYTNGDVIGVAYDASTGAVMFYKNGVLQGTPSATITGTIYPNIGSQGASTGVVTTNFGAKPFAYPAPQGYLGLY